MNVPIEHPAAENRRLRRCISNLVSLFALQAVWSGGDPNQIVRTSLNAIDEMLDLDLVYIRLKEPAEGTTPELARSEQSELPIDRVNEIGRTFDRWLTDDPRDWPRSIADPIGVGQLSIAALPLGIQGEIGVLVAGSRRAGFPEITDQLLLSVAANQAASGLQGDRLLREQRRVADELDLRVAKRTEELAAANRALLEEVAERKTAEDRLRQEEKDLARSEARKAANLQASLDCIVTIDPNGTITEFNPAAERTFGFRRDQVMGKILSGVLIPPSHRAARPRRLLRYLAAEKSGMLGRSIETTAQRADGSDFPVEVAIARIASDGPPSFCGFLRDITERRQAEEELRRSEAFLAEAQLLSRTGSFSWRVATDEISWSEQLYRTFEFDFGMPVTLQLIATRIHPEDLLLFEDQIERSRKDGSQVQIELRLQMPDDSVKFVEVVAHGRNDDGQLEYIGAVQDVTQRRHFEQELGHLRLELAHVARVSSLGVLTASIAHEVNQPLAGIITNASTCLRMLAADTPNLDGARETARRTIRDANRASEVISRLRALFSRQEAPAEAIELNDAAREVIALLTRELQKNQVVLRTDFGISLPSVWGDRVQLQQVILNLILNASGAMADVMDRPRQMVIRTRRDDGDQVRLDVEDARVGIDPGNLEKLFEPFHTTKADGMGIGLSVSRSIVESRDGRIWATPNQGPGATFSFSLPCTPAGGRSAFRSEAKGTPSESLERIG